MSVEKFNPIISGETIPYTMVHTQVVQNITDPIAGFIWIYLLTLPPDWIVVKEHIKQKYGFGDNKIKRIFSYLKSCNLIEYVQENKDGRFRKSEIRILNGSKFKNIPSKVIHKTAGSISAPPEIRSSGSGALQSKQDTNEIEKQNIYSCPTEVGLEKKDIDRFEEFYAAYPRKEGKKAAYKAWYKAKLNEIADGIISALIARVKSDYSKREIKHIPLPATYLNGELWRDELSTTCNENESKHNQEKRTSPVLSEPRSTVQEWGPGHPGWEELNKFDTKHREELLNAAAQGSAAQKLLEKAIEQRGNQKSNNSLCSSVPKASDYLSF